jgi:hypothetical protein
MPAGVGQVGEQGHRFEQQGHALSVAAARRAEVGEHCAVGERLQRLVPQLLGWRIDRPSSSHQLLY